MKPSKLWHRFASLFSKPRCDHGPPSLGTMPQLVFENILQHSDWKSVLCLRQVCRHLRYQVDNAPDSSLPESNFTKLLIEIEYQKILLKFESLYEGHSIVYNIPTYGKKMWRQYKQGKKTEFKTKHGVDMAAKDLAQVLRFQKSTLKELEFVLNIHAPDALELFPSALRNVLASRNRLIATGNFEVPCCKNPNDVMCILPFLDPNCLKRIKFWRVNERPLDFKNTEVVRSKQWNSAEELDMQNCKVPAQHLTNFSRIDIRNHYSFTAAEIDDLRTAFSTSSNFTRFRAHGDSVPPIEQLSRSWGLPVLIDAQYNCWFFRMFQSTDVLEVYISHGGRYVDPKIEMIWKQLNEIPTGVAIRDIELCTLV